MNVHASVMGEREIELIDYLRVLARWKWLIFAGTLAAALIVFVTSVQGPRAFRTS